MPGRQLRRQPLQWGGELQVFGMAMAGREVPFKKKQKPDGLQALAI